MRGAATLYILSTAAIHASSLGTYCRPKAYIIASAKYMPISILFSPGMERQHMSLSWTQVVAGDRICLQL